jgi:hypothetical protein
VVDPDDDVCAKLQRSGGHATGDRQPEGVKDFHDFLLKSKCSLSWAWHGLPSAEPVLHQASACKDLATFRRHWKLNFLIIKSQQKLDLNSTVSGQSKRTPMIHKE